MDRRRFLSQFGTAGIVAAFPAGRQGQTRGLPERKIRVGVIGCGSVSHVYLPHLSGSPYVELVSTCDIKPQRAIDQAERFDMPHAYPHIDAMLDGAPFDMMVNLTDMQEHGWLNERAVEAGRHVWSEKPLANSYQEGLQLLDVARRNGVRIWGAPAVVTSPQFAFMARTINEGKLGRVAAGHAEYGHTGPDWSAFFYEKGGGSMPDLAVYNLTTLTGLLGPARSVMAMTSVITPTRTVRDKGVITVEAEDNAMVLMDHGHGTFSHVQSGFNYYDPYGHHGGLARPTIQLYGTKGNMGLIGYDWAPQGVELVTEETDAPQRQSEDQEGYVWEQGAAYVIERMVKGEPSLITPLHALHVLEVMEAARESQETGMRIGLRSTFEWPVVQ